MIQYLSEAEILLIHFKLIERYGGSHGVRDLERIKSVTESIKKEAFGREQYSTIYQKAAVYIRNIIADHPFCDGNKRTGISAGALFLLRNNIAFAAQKGELEDFAVRVATEHLDVAAIASWLEDRCPATN